MDTSGSQFRVPYSGDYKLGIYGGFQTQPNLTQYFGFSINGGIGYQNSVEFYQDTTNITNDIRNLAHEVIVSLTAEDSVSVETQFETDDASNTNKVISLYRFKFNIELLRKD